MYINSTGHYLPGPAIDNDEIENILGLVNGKKSRLKRKILQSNGIKTRHYAINQQQQTQISNSEMAAHAGQNCLDASFISPNQVEMLSVATSQGDLVLPGFGSMVQAELDISNVELQTSHGICSSSMMALKSAFTNIKAQESTNALVIASELASRLFKHTRYEQVKGDVIDFNAEFLRWMLSDGAGALLLENQPRKTGKSLRIDWIKSFSHADVYPVCMSVGTAKGSDKSWQDFATYSEAEQAGALLLRQDVRLLDNIVSVGVNGFLKLIQDEMFSVDKIDHVLCHFSSAYFKSKIVDMLGVAGVSIPEEKWYTNLYERGNTGCASIFIMLDEFLATHSLAAGETLFCMVPESGRFNCAYMHLTVVE
ncbi:MULTISPECIES: beta-ketoacyl-ACP synthase III [unclassified Shewanella]|uniref:beta-ketoacyl-ACP synthase III n=1 Tax=unclassified Shewanella TaxID=196818 RepID=UPI001F536546|nr:MULTISPECIES: beta-ketoacyl-ACP synthase III [unclassified Shewanella]MDO6777060.1 beta-ketoacyl-ACP synthase III [Shewanella sp. 3_MG-2023]